MWEILDNLWKVQDLFFEARNAMHIYIYNMGKIFVGTADKHNTVTFDSKTTSERKDCKSKSSL